jgi:hypothetical protein
MSAREAGNYLIPAPLKDFYGVEQLDEALVSSAINRNYQD